jgi:hypothetical protein
VKEGGTLLRARLEPVVKKKLLKLAEIISKIIEDTIKVKKGT